MSEFKLVPIQELPRGDLLDQIIGIYENGYGSKFIGRQDFMDQTLLNTSEIALIWNEIGLAAVANLNNNRIIALSVALSSTTRGYGIMMLQQIAQHRPCAWFTAVTSEDPFLKTATDQRHGFRLVTNKKSIENLFRGIRGVGEFYRVNMFEDPVSDLIRERLSRRDGLRNSALPTMHRPGQWHDEVKYPNYHQLVFQNK